MVGQPVDHVGVGLVDLDATARVDRVAVRVLELDLERVGDTGPVDRDDGVGHAALVELDLLGDAAAGGQGVAALPEALEAVRVLVGREVHVGEVVGDAGAADRRSRPRPSHWSGR